MYDLEITKTGKIGCVGFVNSVLWTDILIKLLHGVIDGVCQRGSLKYQDYSSIWNLEQWWEVTDKYKELCTCCLRQNWSRDELNKKLESLPNDYRDEAINAIFVRKDDIRNSLENATCALSNCQLADFDWQLKLVMASDKISSVQQPLLSVDFQVDTEQGNKTVSLELDKAELQKMITSLEAANKVVQQLKT